MKKHTYLFVSSALLLSFIVFTILVKTVDVKYIYNNTYLGFYDLNFKFGNWAVNFGKYNGMRLISDIILYVGIGYSGLILVFGVIQLIRLKSLKLLNRRYFLLLGAYALIAFVFLFFEVVKVNFSPGSSANNLKASYPSTHVFIGCSLFLINSYTAIKLLNPEKKWFIDLIYVSTGLICLLLVFTRMLSLKHWLTDIIGAILLVSAVYTLYIYISHRTLPTQKEEVSEEEQN